MRITAGEFRGRNLVAPVTSGIRPTSDKVRQAVFNLLQHHPQVPDFSLNGARVVDLFAGTGAMGLEALSRGARFCLFIDEDVEARGLLRQNIENFSLTGSTRIWRRDATALGRLDTVQPFQLAFLDPPYRENLILPALHSLRDGGWLTPAAIAIAECDEGEFIGAAPGFDLLDRRSYGSTAILMLRLS